MTFTTWMELNAKMQTATEEDCVSLLKAEKEDRKRKQFLLRIHSRLNRLRAARERSELVAIAELGWS